MKPTDLIVIEGELPRGHRGVMVACVCGGAADPVDTTDEEEYTYGCGRRGCCCGAFKCRLCGKRLLAQYEAPEDVWS